MFAVADLVNIIIVVIITATDVAFVIRKLPTISNRLRDYAVELSIAPCVWGAIGGHVWGGGGSPVVNWWVSIPMMLIGIAGVGLVHWNLRRILFLPRWIGVIYVAAGLPIGLVFWPQ